MDRITKIAWILTLGTTSSIALGQQPAPAPAAPAAAPAAVAAPEPATAPVAAPAQAVASEAAKESGEEPFGKAGVINVGSDISLNLQHTGYSAPSGGVAPSSVTTYAIGPAADYFVIDNLSLGAMVLFGRTTVSAGVAEAKADVIGFEPRVGYHISLVPEKLGLWPRVSYFYEHTKIMVDGSPDTTMKAMGIGVFVPLLIHPV